MKKFALLLAAVAGITLLGMNNNAEASHRCYGNRGFGGGYYAPVHRGGFYTPAPAYRHNYYHSRSFNRGFYGHPGFYGRPGFGHPGVYGPRSGFGIQTRSFGLYIR